MRRKDFIKKSMLISAGAFLFSPSILAQDKPADDLTYTTLKPLPYLWKPTEINAAWIGHATVLINFYGTIILTDPVMFNTVGIYMAGLTIGPRRYTLPALSFDELPQPDIVLLSHAHMDHMDYKSLINLTDKFPDQIDCITAKNTSDVINELNWKSLKELDWTDEMQLNDIRFKALQVSHFGWRYPWEKDRSRGFIEGRSYNAYLIEKNGKKIVFGGDTAMTDKFKEADLNIDIAIMPIGAYNPWRRVHATPEEALIMSSHMNAKFIIPIHYFTFHQGQEPINEPIEWLKKSAPKYNIEVAVDQLGGTFNYKEKIKETSSR